jgi:DNA polymerase III sliding clamp (beta) subunit (PCNA family)
MIDINQASDFVALVKAALIFASKDETRPHIGGVFLEAEGAKLTAYATDGTRASSLSVHANADCAVSAFLPLASAVAVSKMTMQKNTYATITHSGDGFGVLSVKAAGTSAAVPCGDASFLPNIKRVLSVSIAPRPESLSFRINASYVGDVAKALALLGDKTGHVVVSPTGSPVDPIVITPLNAHTEAKFLVMPCQAK